MWISDSWYLTVWFYSVAEALREKCANTEFFLVRIFPHSHWIWRDMEYLSVFSPNAGKYGPEKTTYLDTFHTVRRIQDLPKIHDEVFCKNFTFTVFAKSSTIDLWEGCKCVSVAYKWIVSYKAFFMTVFWRQEIVKIVPSFDGKKYHYDQILQDLR